MIGEYAIGDSGGALLLTWGEDESKQAVVCTKELEVILTEGELITPDCRRKLMEGGVKRESENPYPYPTLGEPDHDDEYAGKPAVNVTRQFVCPRHGVVDTFSTFILVEELEALEPLWVE